MDFSNRQVRDSVLQACKRSKDLPAEEGPIFMSILPTIALCFLPRLVTRSRTYHFPQPGRETRKNNVKISKNPCEKLESFQRGGRSGHMAWTPRSWVPQICLGFTQIFWDLNSFDECIFFYF